VSNVFIMISKVVIVLLTKFHSFFHSFFQNEKMNDNEKILKLKEIVLQRQVFVFRQYR
jgi:hypothetical protein